MTSNSISMESGKKRHSRFKLQFLLFVHSPLIGVLKKKLKKQKQKNKKQIFVNDKDTKKIKIIKTIGEKTQCNLPSQACTDYRVRVLEEEEEREKRRINKDINIICVSCDRQILSHRE